MELVMFNVYLNCEFTGIACEHRLMSKPEIGCCKLEKCKTTDYLYIFVVCVVELTCSGQNKKKKYYK